jgi:hypothetical protein
MIKMYFCTVYWIEFKMCYYTIIVELTALLQFSVYDLTAITSIWMLTEVSYLSIITSGCTVWNVKRMISITSSRDKLHYVLLNLLAGLRWIICSNIRTFGLQKMYTNLVYQVYEAWTIHNMPSCCGKAHCNFIKWPRLAFLNTLYWHVHPDCQHSNLSNPESMGAIAWLVY